MLFTDVCDSARLSRDLGDAAAHELAAPSLTLIANVTASHGGEIVKTMGYAAMATFPNADCAYQAAVDIQDGLVGGAVQIKIGFHVGPVIVSVVDNDVFGDTVNLAARLLARAGPGEILLTGTCVDEISPECRASVSLLDTTSVKGRPDPVEIYRVISQEHNVTIVVPSTKVKLISSALLFSYNWTDFRQDARDGPLLIGRDASCRIVVESERASRRHCTIDRQRDRLVLTDHSTNGTFIAEEGADVRLVKREAANLGNSGTISLGAPPDENPGFLIRYRPER